MKSRQIFGLTALALAASLTACGGGGSGDTPLPASATVQAPTQTPVTTNQTSVTPTQTPVVPTQTPVAPTASMNNLVTSVPTPTYATDSEELAAFNLLNSERNACGFGLLAQSATIDSSAQGHSNYQVLNKLITHIQNQQTMPTGFTGTTPLDRIIAAKYAVSSTDQLGPYEVISAVQGSDVKTGRGVVSVRRLLDAPYHMPGMLSETRDVGIAVRNGADNNTTAASVYTTIDFSSKASAGDQLADSSTVRTYPCNGTTGAIRQLSGEIPSPVPGRDLVLNPIGSSVYINVRKGNIIAINTASFVNLTTGVAVAMRAPVTKANDPNNFYRPYEAYVSADAPLDKSTSYRVMITGTNNGTSFGKNFVFTTSAD